MEDTFTCPRCDMGNAYFDGSMYVCPDCDYEWGSRKKPKENNRYLGSPHILEYEELRSYHAPFFKLEHGKLYDCKVKTPLGIEDTSIIPLAFENNRNRQFVMADARRLLKRCSWCVRDIIKMDFNFIMRDRLLDDYPPDYHINTVLCATTPDKTLWEYGTFEYFDFNLTDEI